MSLEKLSIVLLTLSTTFESAIDKNPTLSDIDKFNYLNSLLENTAADTISGLTLTSGNHNEAIVILKKRFGNKQLAIIIFESFSSCFETKWNKFSIGFKSGLRGGMENIKAPTCFKSRLVTALF